MPPIVLALLNALIPILVNEAEKLFSRGNPDAGSQKHQWVTDMINQELVPMLERRLPDFLKPDAQELGRLVDDAIEKALKEAGL